MTLTDVVRSRLTQAIDYGDDESEVAARPPVTTNPRIIEIASMLEANLLLVMPTLTWIQGKLAEMEAARLAVLYSPEELEALKVRLGLLNKGTEE